MAMSWADRAVAAVQALQGRSVYQQAPTSGADIRDPQVEASREALGGQLQPIPQTQIEWSLDDLAVCSSLADWGQMSKVAKLWRVMKRDGFIGGLSETRTAGLVRLPKRWRGDQAMIDTLRKEGKARPVFDELFPPSELALLAADGLVCGVGVGEMVPVVGRAYPQLTRLDPEFLWYRWNEGRWYYQSTVGLLPINPGDGRWILHTPGGTIAPWQSALWWTLGRAFVHKEHAMLMRGNFSGKLANPARYAKTSSSSTEEQRKGFLSRLIAWGVNTVFELPPGWEVGILETNGRGWEVFDTEIATSNLEIMIALAGQVVTITGGAGFSNADVHETIRADLIQKTGDALAYTINTQGIPPWAYAMGDTTLEKCPRFEWDTNPATDRSKEAEALNGVSAAIVSLRDALAVEGIKLDVNEIVSRFGVPIAPGDPIAIPTVGGGPEPAPGKEDPANAINQAAA